MRPDQLLNDHHFIRLPLIAILRGITPDEVIPVAEILIQQGYGFIEVPLNSPEALTSIQQLNEKYTHQAWIGAGTVTNISSLNSVLNTGAKLIVTPNMDIDVIKRAVQAGCVVLPGIATPTEAFAALQAGASGLKLFPAELITPTILKAFRAILPTQLACFPVGGINADVTQMQNYLCAGADGFGLGSGLYHPAIDLIELEQRAIAYRTAWLATKASQIEPVKRGTSE